MKPLLLTIAMALASLQMFAQQYTLRGKISDDNGHSIPFATVYIQNSTNGTSANNEGEYTLTLNKGQRTIVYRAVGYKQEIINIDLQKNEVKDVILKTEVYQLQTVSISAKGEDPSYAIIREAIKKRKFHLKEVKNFTADVYIKGLQKMLDAPKRFMGRDISAATQSMGLDSNRRGIIYLSESQSKLSFSYPDQVHEEMISSKVSGNNRAFSFNRASDLKVDFYENYQDWGEISLRPLISPIADNALFYYRYKYIGQATQDGQQVNKIQVTPRREHDPCFEGFIYIQDDSWRITAADLFITKKANIRFVDTLRVNQQFLPVKANAWLPSTVRFDFTAGLLGFKVGGYFICVYSNYDVNPTFGKKDFNELLRITRDVNKKDSLYWLEQRPIPLTDEEKNDYRKKEALALKRESKPYLDSLDKANNKVKLGNFIAGGINIRNRYKREYYHFDPIPTSLLFNTVEGLAINYGASFTKRIDTLNNRNFSVRTNLRYGFANRLFNANASVTMPAGKFMLGLNGGSDVADMNNNRPMSNLINSYYTLFERQNFQKLYQKTFASASLSGRITGAWQASIATEWANRHWLANNSNYSFFRKERTFTSNNPLVPGVDVPLFPDNQSFKIGLRTTYNFSNKYETYPAGRRYLPSKYPTIGLSLTKAFNNVLGSDVNYTQLSADVSQSNISMGVYGKTSFYLSAGKFISKSNLYFTDYHHFNGNQVSYYTPAINSYLLLNYYQYSTASQYLEGHLQHNFSGFITNKLPLIRKLKLEEIININYLSTPELKNYYEVGVGLQYLNFRVMYGRSYNSGINATSAFRFSASF
ncbi:DUF5686 and carboxypeptidase regulatory-like domain-containing protein [Mucilaginibacter auburnensis]|nr:DUF5686 and carboxypeptidase regulatory-like domain-containing protein [Mucilaginibacter auburnensis]